MENEVEIGSDYTEWFIGFRLSSNHWPFLGVAVRKTIVYRGLCRRPLFMESP